MRLRWRRFDLELKRRWTIARTQSPGGGGGEVRQPVVFVRLEAPDGVVGLGEASPCERYDETADSVEAFLERVDPDRLRFEDLAGSRAWLETVAPGQQAAKCAVDLALVDGAARRAGKRAGDFLGAGFTEDRHLTSFSIGIDRPERIREKVVEAGPYPVLKLKLGSRDDRALLRALREAAPDKPVRVDANEAWTTPEEALRQIDWLAADGRIEFVEQPMPATTPLTRLAWLKARSPLPLMADEGYQRAGDLAAVADGYHAVNVKLVKTGGLTGGLQALQAARAAGLKTMLGCMIESSLLITAATHLADLTDWLDLDGHLLIANDPYRGMTAVNGRVSLAAAPGRAGLLVEPASPDQDW